MVEKEKIEKHAEKDKNVEKPNATACTDEKQPFSLKKAGEKKHSTQNATACTDEKCALHGSLKVRGNIFTGKVVSAKARKTVTVERVITHFVPKFERYKKVRSKIAAYNPDCIGARENDVVKIGECRKLSKTKAFVVLGIEKPCQERVLDRQKIPSTTIQRMEDSFGFEGTAKEKKEGKE